MTKMMIINPEKVLKNVYMMIKTEVMSIFGKNCFILI